MRVECSFLLVLVMVKQQLQVTNFAASLGEGEANIEWYTWQGQTRSLDFSNYLSIFVSGFEKRDRP